MNKSNPKHSASYRASPTIRKSQRLGTKKMLSRNVIKPVQNKWAETLVFKQNNHGFLWFCVNYRQINNLTWWNSYPTQCENDCINSLEEAIVLPPPSLTTRAYIDKWELMKKRTKDRSHTWWRLLLLRANGVRFKALSKEAAKDNGCHFGEHRIANCLR